MITTEMNNQYVDYLETHINGVRRGYDWLRENLPEVIEKADPILLEDNITNHDKSKYAEDEWEPYVNYFYGKKTKAVEQEFNYAWLHHIHCNPHHWQYWVLIHDDEPIEILDMPYEYIVEMVCDWWTFSWKTGNLLSIFDWYDKHKEMMLSDKTRKTLEDILDKMRKKLEELENGRNN